MYNFVLQLQDKLMHDRKHRGISAADVNEEYNDKSAITISSKIAALFAGIDGSGMGFFVTKEKEEVYRLLRQVMSKYRRVPSKDKSSEEQGVFCALCILTK